MAVPGVDPEKIRKAIERADARTAPAGGQRRRAYVDVVLAAFDELMDLRRKGVLLRDITTDFEAEGLLPKNANASSLGRALRNEIRRRAVTVGRQIAKRSEERKATSPVTPRPVKPAAPSGVPVPEDAVSKAARIKALTGTVVKTPSGEVTKNFDGSFEY
jgi:hypothetical protein